mgnify:CR=1 FL=1
MSKSGYLLGILCLLFLPAHLAAHNTSVSGTHLVDYHNDTIERVVAPGFSWNNLGGTALTVPIGSTSQQGGMTCITSAALNLDVRDSYAYEIAEDVTLSFQIDPVQSSNLFSCTMMGLVGQQRCRYQ